MEVVLERFPVRSSVQQLGRMSRSAGIVQA
jgi:hypothetical protein